MLNLQYKVGVKRQIVQALRAVYHAPTFPDQEMSQKINVALEYPILQEKYPAIYVNFSERSLYDAGLGHFTIEKISDGSSRIFRHWLFEGQATFNIMALDPLERDMIAASLTGIMAMGKDVAAYKPFFEQIYDEDFVSLQLNTSAMYPGGETVGPAPWENSNENIFITSYGADAVGSFISEPETGNLIRISEVRTYPYREGQPKPHGSLHPLDVKIPWE